MQVGKGGDGEGELQRPSGVAVDREGYVYVVDWGHEIVQVYDPEGHFAARLIGDCPGFSKWAVARMASNPENMAAQRAVVTDFTIERIFFNPTSIEIDDDNRILIVDCGRHRIQIYEKTSF